MVAGGMHGSTEKAPETEPETSMFLRAGKSTSKKASTANVTESMSKAMTQIASALTPSSTAASRASGGSPAQIIDNRSKCYKQLGELRSLKESSLLSDAEYDTERAAVMTTFKNLN